MAWQTRFPAGRSSGERNVHLDGCVEVEAAYYGAPPGWIGRLVNVQWNKFYVRLLDPRTGELLREHLRQKRGGYRINNEDYPKRTPFSTRQLLARAERAGSHIGAFCRAIHQAQGELGVRRMLGVLDVARIKKSLKRLKWNLWHENVHRAL